MNKEFVFYTPSSASLARSFACKLNSNKLVYLFDTFQKLTDAKKIILATDHASASDIIVEFGLISNLETLKNIKNNSIYKIYQGTDFGKPVVTEINAILPDYTKNPKAVIINTRVCRSLVKNKIAYAFPFSSILGNRKIASKLYKDLKLCKKFKIPVLISSFSSNPFDLRSQKDLQALLRLN